MLAGDRDYECCCCFAFANDGALPHDITINGWWFASDG